MKKFKNLIFLFIVVFMTFGVSQLVQALNYGSTVKITGSNKLPNLFYEHNLYNQKSEYNDYIYCIEPDKTGSEHSIHEGIVVDNLSLFTNEQASILKAAALNGYPNVIINNFSSSENQCITAMALRCLSMEFKNLTRGRSAETYINDQQGSTLAKAECRKLIIKSKSLPFINEFSNLSLKNISNGNIAIPGDTTRVGQAYLVESTNISGPINLSCATNNLTEINYPNSIMPGEVFYVSVPIKDTFKKIDIKFTATAKTTKDIVFIKANDSSRQSYVGLISLNKNIDYKFDFKLDEGYSKLVLIKKDIETNEILTGVKFKFWSEKPEDVDDEKNSLGIFTTDEQGKIFLSNLNKLGKYYYAEISPPLGYFIENETIDSINIDAFGNTYNKTVYNRQIPFLSTFIQLKGYKQTASNQPLKYEVFGAINASNVNLKDFSLNIDIPYEYADIDNDIEIGKFINAQGYQIFYKDLDDKSYEVKKNYIDNTDNQILNTNSQNMSKIQGIFTNDVSGIVSFDKTSIKEVVIKLAPTSNGNEFITPIFGEGNYSIYIKDYNSEYLLGENYKGDIENKFNCTNLRSYKIVFDKPISIDNFTSGKFSTLKQSTPNYSIYFNTIKRNKVLINNNMKSDEINKINISQLYDNGTLNKDENIVSIKILFNEQVNSGFKQMEPIFINGTTNNFENLSNKYFEGKRESLYYSCKVDIEGEYNGESVKDNDDWDTTSFSKSLSLNKGVLPKTGGLIMIMVGISSICIGSLFIIKWRYINEK